MFRVQGSGFRVWGLGQASVNPATPVSNTRLKADRPDEERACPGGSRCKDIADEGRVARSLGFVTSPLATAKAVLGRGSFDARVDRSSRSVGAVCLKSPDDSSPVQAAVLLG